MTRTNQIRIRHEAVEDGGFYDEADTVHADRGALLACIEAARLVTPESAGVVESDRPTYAARKMRDAIMSALGVT